MVARMSPEAASSRTRSAPFLRAGAGCGRGERRVIRRPARARFLSAGSAFSANEPLDPHPVDEHFAVHAGSIVGRAHLKAVEVDVVVGPGHFDGQVVTVFEIDERPRCG